MVIEPKIRGFICTTAHPIGCYHNVEQQVQYVKAHGEIKSGPKNVLVIGCSTGYGLASRIVLAFGANAKTLGVCFEKPASEKRTATAGWYNTAAFEKLAERAGLYAKTINGDAFSDDIKKKTIELIKKELGKIDCVVYSLASPRRTHPKTGETFHSTLKPVNSTYENKTVDPMSGVVSRVALQPATTEEVAHTVAVMGGEDWAMWMDALREADVLSDNAVTLAYTYVGPELTHAIYKNGTIGKAKDDLLATARALDNQLSKTGGRALVAVNKAVVTQASAAIPVVPLYISILFRLMKARGTHENCIEQMDRLFRNFIYTGKKIPTDGEDRIRVDNWEMAPDIQSGVEKLWAQVTTENLMTLTDVAGYREEFYRLFGFNVPGVDYQADVSDADVQMNIPSML